MSSRDWNPSLRRSSALTIATGLTLSESEAAGNLDPVISIRSTLSATDCACADPSAESASPATAATPLFVSFTASPRWRAHPPQPRRGSGGASPDHLGRTHQDL